jgi:hypothetical protein
LEEKENWGNQKKNQLKLNERIAQEIILLKIDDALFKCLLDM